MQALDENLDLVRFTPLIFICSMALFMGIGWLFGYYRSKKAGETEVVVRDAVVAAIFGLAALVLGFVFSSASNHYEFFLNGMRNQANAIKEMYISTKYLQTPDQVAIKKSLSELLDFRLTFYQEINNHAHHDLNIAIDKMAALVRKITEDMTKAALSAPQENQPIIANIVPPQLRDLSASFTLAGMLATSRPSKLLMRFFYTLLCAGAMLIGYTMAVKKESDWFLSSLYVLLMGSSFYVIVSFEFPTLFMPYDESNKDLLMLKNWLGSH